MEDIKNKKKNLLKNAPFRMKLLFHWWSLKKIIKEITRDKTRILTIFIFVLAFVSLISGIVVFSGFLSELRKTYTIYGNNSIELEKTGQVGDFIGGVVGALWSFTGTLLFFIALQLQRTELTEMRKEAQVTRLTDIIYKQLDYFNKHLQEFKLVDIDRDQRTYTGAYATTMLRNKLESGLAIDKETNEEIRKDIAMKFNADLIALVQKNEESFLNLFDALDSSCDVIRAILFKDTIPPADLNELKALFFKNIHHDLLNSAEYISTILAGYLTLKEQAGEKREHFLDPLERLIRTINILTDFRRLIYDKANTKRNDRMRDMYNQTQV